MRIAIHEPEAVPKQSSRCAKYPKSLAPKRINRRRVPRINARYAPVITPEHIVFSMRVQNRRVSIVWHLLDLLSLPGGERQRVGGHKGWLAEDRPGPTSTGIPPSFSPLILSLHKLWTSAIIYSLGDFKIAQALLRRACQAAGPYR